MSIEGIDTSRDGGHPGFWEATDDRGEGEWSRSTKPDYLRWSQRMWRRAVEADFPPDGDVLCDPRTFVPLRETVLLSFGVTGAPAERMMTAMSAATARMPLVSADGREAESSDEVEEEWDDEDEDEDSYTINYVSEPELVGQVAGVSNIDTKGERYPWMLRTFLRIVAEELRAAGAVPATIVPFVKPETAAWLRSRSERLPDVADLY